MTIYLEKRVLNFDHFYREAKAAGPTRARWRCPSALIVSRQCLWEREKDRVRERERVRERKEERERLKLRERERDWKGRGTWRGLTGVQRWHLASFHCHSVMKSRGRERGWIFFFSSRLIGPLWPIRHVYFILFFDFQNFLPILPSIDGNKLPFLPSNFLGFYTTGMGARNPIIFMCSSRIIHRQFNWL